MADPDSTPTAADGEAFMCDGNSEVCAAKAVASRFRLIAEPISRR
jgi:hypothetical protein